MMSEAPTDPQSFSMGVHLRRRTKKKPEPAPQTIRRRTASSTSSASMLPSVSARQLEVQSIVADRETLWLIAKARGGAGLGLRRHFLAVLGGSRRLQCS